MTAHSARPATRQRQQAIVPRILRATHEAPAYLGMSYEEFNKTVRPHLQEFRIGKQGVGFDRHELDAWFDEHTNKQAIDLSPTASQQSMRSGRQGGKKWREKPSQGSTKGTASGTSIKCSGVVDFKRALEQAKGKKQSNT